MIGENEMLLAKFIKMVANDKKLLRVLVTKKEFTDVTTIVAPYLDEALTLLAQRNQKKEVSYE